MATLSWAKFAKQVLGVTPQVLSGWRKREGAPDDQNECAWRLWHDKVSHGPTRRGPQMASLSEPAREILVLMGQNRQHTAAPIAGFKERQEAVKAEQMEMSLAEKKGDLLSRSEVERAGVVESKALLLELDDFADRFLSDLDLPAAEMTQVRDSFERELGVMRDRLAGVADSPVMSSLVASLVSATDEQTVLGVLSLEVFDGL